MQGDFSRWDPLGDANRAGVLHQQGRVLLDRDWNDQARIAGEWQDTAARDAIGPAVLGVPSAQPWAFRVEGATVAAGGVVTLAVRPGRAWADGVRVTLPRAAGDAAATPATVQRTAAYLDASVQASPGSVGSIAAGVRDAVILEVWRETFSAFQLPDELLEPALGGPDTTARILTSFRFRLARLAAGEDCHTVALADRARGRLHASLRPATVLGGDCPVPDDGGFTGFEHQLYRVEVAEVSTAGAWFKHSRFNGGLVARGTVHLSGPTPHFTLTGNDLAVRTAGQTAFYLEVVAFDADVGAWRTTYGAEVQLDGDDLNVVTPRLTAVVPADSGANDPGVFFRLWDGIRPITAFPPGLAEPNTLASGIRLAFPDAAAAYRPGDHWTFPLRAGGLHNAATLVDNRPPEGIRYHRVPVAELEWEGAAPATLTRDDIEDCRRIFRPLTDQDGCCTFTVGDGVRTHGDFDDVQEAVRHLPAGGGKICLLAGIHRANVRILGRTGVEVSGCGARTLVIPRTGQEDEPLFLVAASRRVRIHHLTLVTQKGTAVRVDDGEADEEDKEPSAEIHVEHNRIVAGVHAVEMRPRNTRGGDNDLVVSHNRIGLLDTAAGRAAILFSGDGVLIERNRVVVVPEQDGDDPADPRGPDAPGDPAFDPCDDGTRLYGATYPIVYYVVQVMLYVASVGAAPSVRYAALGGIQVAGGSERVRILENEVVGGRGHGVTLAELPRGDADGGGEAQGEVSGFFIDEVTVDQANALDGFDAVVYDVEIDRNVIRDMGMCGIGVAAFFAGELEDASGEPVPGLLVRAEGLVVSRNRIERCLRDPEPIPTSMRGEAALGGIALADCAGAVFSGNRVEDNGTETDEPVCGIFVLAGDRVELQGNTVAGNGPAAGSAERRLSGLRAGIMVAFGMARALQAFGFGEDEEPVRGGLPAVRVVGNAVSQPMGQALVVGAIGPVAVTGNSFTSADVDFRTAPLAALAATVLILDLALSKDLLFTLVFFSQAGQVNPARHDRQGSAADGLEALALLPSGGVLFAGNQVTLDLRGRQIGFALSSVLIASLDDVGFTDNQCEVTSFVDWLFVDTLLAGVTVRAADNRWQEGITFVFFSLYAWAMMNTVTMNQSTNCLSVNAPPGRVLDFGNQVWRGTVPQFGFLGCGGNFPRGEVVGVRTDRADGQTNNQAVP